MADHMKLIPERIRKKLNDKQQRVVQGYSSKTKLQAVLRWRQRMAKGGIDVKELAEEVGKPDPRISEWLNLKVEPGEDNFLSVEGALYKMGV